MNGEVEQLVKLAVDGNRFLRGEPIARTESDDIFQFVGRLAFTYEPAGGALRRAETVASWFGQLAERSVTRLELDVRGRHLGQPESSLPEHLSVAFAGGHRASLVGRSAAHGEVWRGTWRVIPGPRPPDDRIWDVDYRGVEADLDASTPSPTVADASMSLHRALERAARWSERLEGGRLWRGRFLDAEACLVADTAGTSPVWRRLDGDARVEARRLYAAAATAFVFGGMGSWNDMGFADRAMAEEHDAVSADLYGAVMAAIEVAVNHATSS